MARRQRIGPGSAAHAERIACVYLLCIAHDENIIVDDVMPGLARAHEGERGLAFAYDHPTRDEQHARVISL